MFNPAPLRIGFGDDFLDAFHYAVWQGDFSDLLAQLSLKQFLWLLRLGVRQDDQHAIIVQSGPVPRCDPTSFQLFVQYRDTVPGLNIHFAHYFPVIKAMLTCEIFPMSVCHLNLHHAEL
jgi:hypothetical protein